MIELTLCDHGQPPVALSAEAIVAVKPRKSLRPDIANQSPAAILTWSGSQITLPSGVTFNVEEDYAEVLAKLAPPGPEPPPAAAPAKKAAPAKQTQTQADAPEPG